MKILIIGGAGFIGFALLKELINHKASITIIDDFSRGKMDKELKKINKNINVKLLRFDFLRYPLNKISKNFDYVFNCAAIVGVKNVIKNPYKVLSLNTNINEKAIELCKLQKKLKKFIFFSSSEIYSISQKKNICKIPTDEKSNILFENSNSPRNSYMISKFYGEKMCEYSGLPYLILRPHNIYGPRMGFSHVIPNIVYKAIKKNNIKVESPNHSRVFCFITDASQLVISLMKNKKAVNLTINLGSNDKEIKIKRLAFRIKKIIKSKKKLIPTKITTGSVSRRAPDIRLLLKYCKGFKFRSLDNGLTETIDWYKNFYEKN